MVSASIEISGPNAVRLARELRAVLIVAADPRDSVSPVEVERSPELVVAIIGLAFSGVGTAKTIWDWWRSSGSDGITVKILMVDGTHLDLSSVDETQLEIEFRRQVGK